MKDITKGVNNKRVWSGKEFCPLHKIKRLGQVYTPEHIVKDMLDLCGYTGERILRKHIIDNSCGDGAFLTETVNRYIAAYRTKNNSLAGVESELEKYIHGIEIDGKERGKCIDNLNRILFWQGAAAVGWDILNADTLQTKTFDGKMDFVVANPPYVRIHNLQENFDLVRNYEFAQSGMTDLFVVFYELGFKMLNKDGRLVYITPNSFYSSVAGQDFRKYIIDKKHLYALVDLGHYRPFKAAAYTTVCAFDIAKEFNRFDYSVYNMNGKIEFQETLITEDAFNNGKMILAKKQEQKRLKEIQNYVPNDKSKVQVKNAFATLADGVFIKNDFGFETAEIINVIKASTGEWKKCIFPYDKNCKYYQFDKLSGEVKKYLENNKDALIRRSIDKNAPWYAFGRSQAVNDINASKIAVNTTIKDLSSIKINFVPSGAGVYSGLYILTNEPKDKIEHYIKNQDFIDYIKTIGKCKSGGYFTFSSNDLLQYLYYKIGA